MYPRNMIFYYTGVMDFKNKAVLCFQKSIEGSWHGFEIPPCNEEEFVRLDL